MGHGHHHHVDPATGERRVAAAVGVNLALTVAQIVGGVISGSLALIADAVHNLSDALSLIVAFWARRIARRPQDATMTFGYGRAEVVAALVNYTALVMIALYLGSEAVMRLFAPEPVAGWIVVWVAGLALAVDLVTAALTFSLAKGSVNIRAAFLHNLADALGSVAVIVAGGAVLLVGWTWMDPAVTLLIAGYILWMALPALGPVIRILMLGSPPTLDTDAVLAEMERVPGVAAVHHLHLWQLDEHRASLEAHVEVAAADAAAHAAVKRDLRARLAERFGIGHVTLDTEAPGACGARPARIGGGAAGKAATAPRG